jgi:serine/threonine protein kinase
VKLQPGEIYGRYAIADELAEGLCGPVYHAVIEHDTKRKEEVALKFLTNKKSQVVQYFLNEERLLRRATQSGGHPHIVRFVHSNVRDQPYTLATAFTYALSHKEELVKLKSSAVALKIAEQIGSALDYLHTSHPSHPIVHRDVKPDNILVDRNTGIATLIDLSVASHPAFTLVDDRGFGTPPYMAPEQYAGHEVPASDQFALAYVVYYFLYGGAIQEFKPPKVKGLESQDQAIYTEALTTWNDQVQPLVEKQHARIRQTLSRYPKTVEVLIKASAFRPADRYPSCAEFASALGTALSADGASLEQPTLPRDTSRRTAWIGVGAIGLIVVLALAMLFVTNTGSTATNQSAGAGALPTTTLPPFATSTLSPLTSALPPGGFATVTLGPEPTFASSGFATSTLPPLPIASGTPTAGRSIEVTAAREIFRVSPSNEALNILNRQFLKIGTRLTITDGPERVKGETWYQARRDSDGLEGWLRATSFR